MLTSFSVPVAFYNLNHGGKKYEISRGHLKKIFCHTLLELPGKITLIRFNSMYHVEVQSTQFKLGVLL